MKNGALFALIVILSSGTALAQHHLPGGTLVVPTTIDSVPAPIQSTQPVTFSASFATPLRCAFSGGGIGLRVYNKDENGTPPYGSDPFLVETGSNYTFPDGQGPTASATFTPITLPNTAAATIYVAIFKYCPMPDPHGIDAGNSSSTAIINGKTILTSLIGGQFYHRQCTGRIYARWCIYVKA